MLSIDTETTGLDLRHGAAPFFVTTAWLGTDGRPVNTYWEWDVDPLTREVDVSAEDVQEIVGLIEGEGVSRGEGHDIVGQNIKFDVTALSTIEISNWPWDRTDDTLIAAHLLASNRPKDLTTLALTWLGVDIQPFEDALEAAVQKARRMCRSKKFKEQHGEWAIAEKDRADMPSAKDKTWKYDTWLPRAMWRLVEGVQDEFPAWESVLREYANADSAVTLSLWPVMLRAIRERGLESLYRERMRLPPIAYRMESRGVTLSGTRLEQLVGEYEEESERLGRVCVNVAAGFGHELELPANGVNQNLRAFLLDVLGLEPVRNPKAKTDAPTLDKSAMSHYLATLEPRSRERAFVNALLNKRSRDTAIQYMTAYKRFWRPLGDAIDGQENSPDDQADAKGSQDENLLGVDGQQTPGGVRTTTGSRRVEGSPSQLSTTRRPNSSRDVRITPLRQSAVCKPGPSVPGELGRQLGGHGSQGSASGRDQERIGTAPGEAGERRSPSPSRPHKGIGAQDKVRVQRGEQEGRIRVNSQEVRCVKIDRDQSRATDLVAARQLELMNWYVLHPSLNLVGTDTLRWSSSNPNEQNISKKESFNLRYVFGPAPGREWWSLDAKNIELRIPAYESGEEELIALYERPDDPPYYGSNHLLNFHTIYPDLWAAVEREVGVEKVGPTCKKRYAATWYQYAKNGGFAIQYGAQDRDDGQGTADRAFHKPGAHALLKQRFRALESLNQKMVRFAEKHGYVETMPDRTVDPKRGYPLLCTRTEYGRIKPTVPLSYHVQGSAMWWTARAMVKVQAQLDDWRIKDGFDGHIALQVHDELVLDFPKRGDPVKDAELERTKGEPLFRTTQSSNLWRIRVIQKLMASIGDDLIPRVVTPVGCEYHADNWSEGVTL